MTRRPHAGERGTSLVELMIAIGIAILAGSLTTMVFVTQHRALQSADVVRQANEAARDATLELETALRRAGWGVDPRYVLDTRFYGCPSSPGSCRDGRTGPDEMVFVARSPYYQWNDFNQNGCTTAGGCFSGNSWPLESRDATNGRTVTITLRAGEFLHKGRVIQVVCTLGQNATLATVATAVGGPGQQTVQLMDPVPLNPYRENSFSNSCFGQTGAGVFLVDRYHYQVIDFSGTPWLMLDTGLDSDTDGNLPENLGDLDDLIPVAPGIEDVQIAYSLTPTGLYTAPDSDQDWIVGNDASSGTNEELNPTLAAPLYGTSRTDASRFNLHPANARLVRVTLSVRSVRHDPGHTADFANDPPIVAENRSTSSPPAGINYRRIRAFSTVGLRNMDGKASFMF